MSTADRNQNQRQRGPINVLKFFRLSSQEKPPIKPPMVRQSKIMLDNPIIDTSHPHPSSNVSSSLMTQIFDPSLQVDPFGDRKRTQQQYDEAVKLLKESLNLPLLKSEIFELET